MIPSHPRRAILASAVLALAVALPRAARADEDDEVLEADPHRFSITLAGDVGLGTAKLGTPAVGGSMDLNLWGQTTPNGLGLRFGALASGWPTENDHGTVYVGPTVTRFTFIGHDKLFASATLGFAWFHGKYAAVDNNDNPIDSATGPILVVRGGYLVPMGPVRVGIGVDTMLIPGEGFSVLATPLLDLPF